MVGQFVQQECFGFPTGFRSENNAVIKWTIMFLPIEIDKRVPHTLGNRIGMEVEKVVVIVAHGVVPMPFEDLTAGRIEDPGGQIVLVHTITNHRNHPPIHIQCRDGVLQGCLGIGDPRQMDNVLGVDRKETVS